MIHWFEVENFFSFAKATRIDFTSSKVADDHSVAVSPTGARLNKLTAFYGANAAGKTGFVFAMARLADFVANSFNWPTDLHLPFEPHFFNEGQPARLKIQFEVPATPDRAPEVYRYELLVLDGCVVGELLEVRKSRFSRVFERTRKNGATSVTGLGARYADVPARVSFVSWLARHEVPEARRIANYFRQCHSNDFQGFGRTPPLLGLSAAAEAFDKDRLAHSLMVKILREWDFGLCDVEYEKRKIMRSDEVEREQLLVKFVHRRGDKRAVRGFSSESSGTVGLFTQLARILPVLIHGGTAFVDEIEADLHPSMVEVLLDLFRFPDRNPHNAQLIFTTHSPAVMNALNKWSIVLVEKNDCDSTAWRLADMKGVQSRDNHAARYLAGAYGAVPREQIDDYCEVAK